MGAREPAARRACHCPTLTGELTKPHIHHSTLIAPTAEHVSAPVARQVKHPPRGVRYSAVLAAGLISVGWRLHTTSAMRASSSQTAQQHPKACLHQSGCPHPLTSPHYPSTRYQQTSPSTSNCPNSRYHPTNRSTVKDSHRTNRTNCSPLRQHPCRAFGTALRPHSTVLTAQCNHHCPMVGWTPCSSNRYHPCRLYPPCRSCGVRTLCLS